MHEILQQIPNALAIVALEPTPRLSFVNAFFTKHFGYTLQELPPLESWLFPLSTMDSANSHPEIKIDYTRWLKSIATLENQSDAVNILCKNSEIKTAHLFTNQIGERVWLSFVDEFQSPIVEKQSLANEPSFSLFIETMRDTFFSIDTQTWNFNYLSPQVENLLPGHSVGEFMKHPFDQLLTPPARKVFVDRLRDACLKESNNPDNNLFYTDEWEQRCNDGSLIWLEVVSHFIHNPITHRVEMLGMMRNINERKHTEFKHQENQIESEKATKAKCGFLANMSHEIRSPMNAIMGLTELVLDVESTPWKVEHLQSVHNASKTLLSLINDILDYSKIEAGKLIIEYSVFLLTDVIEHTLAQFEPKLNEKGLSLITELDAELPKHLIGDSLRLKQILRNLITNAIKFTEKGEIRIIIKPSTHALSKAKTNNLLFIINTSGYGISEPQKQSLFSPLMQSDVFTNQAFDTADLGLVIAKRLIELMNGEIKTSSIENQGTIFGFALPFDHIENDENVKPIKNPDTKSQTPTSQPLTSAIQQTSSIQGAKILVVDDDPANQLFAKRFLERLKLNVTLIDNGYDAIELVRKNAYDLILMDLMLPGIDGLETTQRIRALEEGKTIPIIAATASGRQDTYTQCIDAGMNDLITKPINLTHLSTTLLQWIKTNDANNDSIETPPSNADEIKSISESDIMRLLSLCSQLAPMLANNLVNSREIILQIESLIANSPLADAFQPVSHAIRHWRYDDAFEALKIFQNTIKG